MYAQESGVVRKFLSPIWTLWFQKVSEILDGYFTTSVEATQFKLTALNTAPSSATDTGTTGEIRVVDGFIYVCTNTNVWKRVAIATWP